MIETSHPASWFNLPANETQKAIQGMHPRDIADAIKGYPLLKIRELLRKIPDEIAAEIIAEFPLEIQVQLFESMRPQRLSGILQKMFTDDASDILGSISPNRLREIIATLSPEDAQEISNLLKYPEDSAGGIMQTEFIAVNENKTIAETIDILRTYEDMENEEVFYIYVVDDFCRMRGVVKMRDLLFKKPTLPVKTIMKQDVRCVSVHADQEEIANLFRNYHYSSLPVVDDCQKLRGIVTSDDVLDVIQEEVTEDMNLMVGLSSEIMIDTPMKRSLHHRLPWLFVNLATAFLAGWVVSLFESTIEKYAVLAIFLPIIAGQGGNFGTQTLTIIVRGLALGEVSGNKYSKILFKEIAIGAISGLAIGLSVGLVSFLWKGSMILGLVVFLAMLFNMLVAAISGVLIPLGLKSIRVDPALASSIFLTTMTDTMGFIIFLGLATIAIPYLG